MFRIVKLSIAAALLLIAIIAWLTPSTRSVASTLLRLSKSYSERIVEDYDFLHSEKERSCLAGDDSRNSLGDIPNVVHFIWGLDSNGSELPFLTYLAIVAALQSIRPTKLKLHHSYLDAQGAFIQQLVAQNVELVYHDPESIIHLADGARDSHWQPAHLADLLRLDILETEGGIYLDSDVFALQSFDQLRRSTRDVVLGYEGGHRHGLCNAVILSRAGSSFLKRWRGTYSGFSAREWNRHSVIIPEQLASDYPSEICTLAPEAFFWPTWTHKHIAYMHETLDDSQMIYVSASLTAHNGSLWPDQVAYHAWSTVSKEHLRHLTPQTIMSTNTRFNLMIRPFLGIMTAA